MTRKGIIEEIFSKARFADDANQYMVFYRDFERIIKATMPEFLEESNNFQTIPISRIRKIMKSNTVLFEKNEEE